MSPEARREKGSKHQHSARDLLDVPVLGDDERVHSESSTMAGNLVEVLADVVDGRHGKSLSRLGSKLRLAPFFNDTRKPGIPGLQNTNHCAAICVLHESIYAKDIPFSSPDVVTLQFSTLSAAMPTSRDFNMRTRWPIDGFKLCCKGAEMPCLTSPFIGNEAPEASTAGQGHLGHPIVSPVLYIRRAPNNSHLGSCNHHAHRIDLFACTTCVGAGEDSWARSDGWTTGDYLEDIFETCQTL